MILKPGSEPIIDVGILLAPSINVRLNGIFRHQSTMVSDNLLFTFTHNKLVVNNTPLEKSISQLFFEPVEQSSFTVENVKYGLDFHWERSEDMTFSGSFRIQLEAGQLRLVNSVKLEDYLKSVIASEMSSKASMPLLKAHAVMSRSWLLRQLINSGKKSQQLSHNTNEHIKWYDREDHAHFDVCADDHCQRYQGISRISNQTALDAVDQTKGLVLMHKSEICDARFSKCCGGISEKYSSCWEDVDFEYLTPITDDKSNVQDDVSREHEASNWVRTKPDVFCNTNNKQILSQVLNDYDLETKNFFRWKESLSSEELKELLKRKLGIEIGDVLDLIPIKRGPSGRIIQLKVVGSKQELILGKELEIRRALSDSHLLSSAFVVERVMDKTGSIQFELLGAGWGHGVGLCQIGAAVMGEEGYTFTQILDHYFKHTTLEKIY